MSSLGQVEVIRADKFDSESAGPTLPGSDRRRSGTLPRSGRKLEPNLSEVVDKRVIEARDSALLNVESLRTSTTLSALAVAQEGVGNTQEACQAAVAALELCVQTAGEPSGTFDQVSARLAIEVLLRAGLHERAIEFIEAMPFSGQVKLSIGALLAVAGRLEDSHRLIDDSTGVGADGVRGFVQVLEGHDHAAVSSLRAALRFNPDDADSALNLSIALWRIGAKSKAIAAALQAARSAPGREDIGLHYLELLLAERELDRFDREIKSLEAFGVVPSARLYILRARSELARGRTESGLRLLELASESARTENDEAILAEIQSNLIRIRAWSGKIDRDQAVSRLVKIHQQFPSSGVVAVSLAQVANRKRHAAVLRDALDSLRDRLSRARITFVEHQIASLEGDNITAAEKAVEWSTLEPEDPNAAVAAMVSLGIGLERWEEAAEFAREAIKKYPDDLTQLNNAAYVLAMVGCASEAIDILKPHAQDSFVLTATLGLSYLAANEITTGMKLYREAANIAEKSNDDSRSLMTAYQAIVVRQLGLLDTNDRTAVTAMSLPPVALPDDWRERSEYLRLQTLAARKGYAWPPSL